MDREKQLTTKIFDVQISRCEDIQEFTDMYEEHKSQFGSWECFLAPYIKKSGYTKKEIAAFCGVNEKTGRNFLKRIPSKRDNVIKLGMVFGMTREEIDYMLMHEARFHKLYPKSYEDAIWIHMIEHNGWEKDVPIPVVYDAYQKRYQDLYKAYQKRNDIQAPLETQIALWKLKDTVEFDQAMKEIIPSITDGYRKLIDFIEQQMRKTDTCISKFDFQNDKNSVSQIYYREIKNIREEQKIPSRIFLIALGIHMNLNVEKINELLDYAGMMPLYSKDILECRLIFYLENLYLCHPSYFTLSEEVCNMMEAEDHLEEDDLAQYIYNRLEEEEIRAGEDHMLEKMMKLL